MEEEKAKEKELEKMIQLEMDAAWEKRIEQWKQDRLARKLLMNDVMEGRARQIRERRKLSSVIISKSNLDISDNFFQI